VRKRHSKISAALAAAIFFASPAGYTRQLTAGFDVDIALHATGTCALKQSSATAEMRCHSGPFVFGALLQRDEVILEGDGFAGLGTTAEYRVVSTPQHQYLELMVGW
jgi:hypothetical protein